ncbi:MAG: type II toxin-antitoxin system RelE/ParE family toxin [Burkholderiales bacterium]
MTYRVRFTRDAEDDLLRLYEFAVERDDGSWLAADRALAAIKNGLRGLQHSPFSYRKATPDNALLREIVIPFGGSGYVALFEIDDAQTVTVLALRHQREDDYH